MKSCPLCHKTYAETLMYCLDDGTALLQVTTPAGDPNATLVLPTTQVTEPGRPVAGNQAPAVNDQSMTAQGGQRPLAAPGLVATPPTRKSPLPWILGLGAVIVLGFLGIVIAFVAMSTWQSRRADREATSSPTPAGITAVESPSSTPDHSSDSPRTETAGTSPRSLPPIRVDPVTSSAPRITTTEPPPPAPKPTPRAPISGGVLNGKAIRLVQPTYPAIARQAHASGTVIVQVTIDEEGNVISAHPVSGHPLLQAAATAAARASKFSPTKLSGQPVKVIGVIQYNFVAQ